MSTSRPSRRAQFVNRAIERLDTTSYVDEWVAAGHDPDRLAEIAARRRKKDRREPLSFALRGWQTVSFPVLAGTLYRLRHDGASGTKAIFYLHGGYYVTGPHPIDWITMPRFCAKRDLDLAVLVYPRAPEFTSDHTLRSVCEAWDLVERRYGADHIAVVGVSAGGGLALSLAMMLRDAGRQQPAALSLSSPWLDLACAHPELAEYEPSDLMLSSAGGRHDGRLYAGSRPIDDPLVSPYYADPAGLCPVQIQVGRNEMFFPECRDFAARCDGAGVDTDLVVDDAGQHVGMLMPTPEGAALRAKMSAFVEQRLG